MIISVLWENLSQLVSLKRNFTEDEKIPFLKERKKNFSHRIYLYYKLQSLVAIRMLAVKILNKFNIPSVH